MPFDTSEMCESHSEKNCPTDRCQLLKTCSQQLSCIPKLNAQRKDNCEPEGSYAQGFECCPGLARRCGKIESNGECNMEAGGYMDLYPECVACGNGTCDFWENRCNCPEDCKKTKDRSKIEFKPVGEANPPIPRISGVLLNPINSGDIPSFAAKLMEAYDRSDSKICDGLLEPVKQVFDHGDYSTSSPTRPQWVSYCLVLAQRDYKLCSGLKAFRSDCEYFFQSRVEQNNRSPQFCYEQYGKIYSSNDQLYHCLWTWKIHRFGYREVDEIMETSNSIEPFTLFELALLKCLEKDHAFIQNQGKEAADRCFFELAKNQGDSKLCGLIRNPSANRYLSSVWTRDYCSAQFSNEKAGAPKT